MVRFRVRRSRPLLLLVSGILLPALVLVCACGVSALFPSYATVAPGTSETVVAQPLETLHVVLDENYPPYSFRNAQGQLQGLSVDLWKLYARKTGTPVELTGMPWSEAYRAMVDSHFDAIDTITFNEERADLFLFTDPYVTMNVPVFVRAGLTGVGSLESLAGFRVGAKKADTAILKLQRLGIGVAVQYPDVEALVLGAAAGEVDAFVAGEPSVMYHLYRHNLQDAFRMGETVYTAEFRRAVAIDNPALLEALRAGFDLISIREREDIQTHWYGRALPWSGWVRAVVIAGCAAGAVLLLLAMWNLALRRVVRDKTKALSEMLERERAHAAQLARQNVTDELTGLRNRFWYEKELTRLAMEPPTSFAVAMCDLDGLKLVNDTIGHPVGDRFLREAARCLKECFPPQSEISRIGGDEFLVLCADTQPEVIDAARIATGNLLRERFGMEYADLVSLSFGMCFEPGMARDVSGMVREADLRMLRAKLHRHQSMRSGLVSILRQMLQARDFGTQDHARRSDLLCEQLGRGLGFHDGQLTDLRLLATFHDIGKIGIPDAVLMKPAKLTPEEFEVMKTHPSIGMRIAQSAVELQPIADLILKHHERWDGKGYPLGIAGEAIPISCRILAVVDAFDAMTNDRPYRAAMSEQAALSELDRCAGTQFDPMIVRLFHDVIAELDAGAAGDAEADAGEAGHDEAVAGEAGHAKADVGMDAGASGVGTVLRLADACQ